MAPHQEKSSLKRARASNGDSIDQPKKPRRSARLSQVDPDGAVTAGALPSPVTRMGTTDDEAAPGTASPPAHPSPPGQKRLEEIQQRATPVSSPPPASLPQYSHGLSSPPSDTQPYSQFLPPPPISYEVEDEEAEGVWGYMVPVNGMDAPMVLRKRGSCPVPERELGVPDGRTSVPKKHWQKKEEDYERKKSSGGVPSEGYLIGRHPECDRIVEVPTVSNRHCLLFSEHKQGDYVAVLEDLSGNGTYINDMIVGRNKRRELQDGDEVSILDQARFIFRYPRAKSTSSAFKNQYTIQGQLGKGHFATVYLATEKSTGVRFAVKKFEKRSGPGEKSKVEGLQQEIGVLMGVSHPNMLCLKDTFDEQDGVYLVLELAPEGELFNWIVMKQKLSEQETRKVFIQLFQGVKYLRLKHERNIVHRDIKPENILLLDRQLHVKVADFGLAKIIGEESFTTTLCGTPSYVAPEILEQTHHRRYTRAVDVWSLGVVLYICLCGFPPFSDELYSPENPYTLSQQIKMGRFDYPSPYWDAVGDPALDLIDRMLEVDVNKRITIDECLAHPWTTAQAMTNVSMDSTDGLTGQLAGLDFSRRKPARERTLLASINEVKVERVIDTPAGTANGGDGRQKQQGSQPVKVFEKNANGGKGATPKKGGKKVGPTAGGHVEKTRQEPRPDEARDPGEFVGMGGKGDEVLFDDKKEGVEGESLYPDETTVKAGAPPGGQ